MNKKNIDKWKTQPVKVSQTKTDSVEDAVITIGQEVKASRQKKDIKEPMTIAKTKIGITLVISKEECEQLGFAQTDTTKTAIKEIKKRLGLGV